jgi:hypothetical protein
MKSFPKKQFAPLDLWIWLCVLLNAAGWLLSAFGALNLGGYFAVVLLITVSSILWWYSTTSFPKDVPIGIRYTRVYGYTWGISL